MQAIAAEMNLSETAFLYAVDQGYHLRWFTPKAEVDLCGHATLASAHVLWSEGHLSPDQTAYFQTRSGELTATLDQGWITLNFPSQPVEPVTPPAELLPCLGLNSARFVGKNAVKYLVEVESAAVVRSLQPNFDLMAQLPAMGVIVTSRSDAADYDFISRFFAPAVGINEDPVTGAAHCALTPYWQASLQKTTLMAYQASARGGILKLRSEGERVFISGRAVTVLRGELLSAPA